MTSANHNPGRTQLLLQCLMLSSLCIFSWLAMMIVHELGHILTGHFTGGKILHVAWHPLAFSYTHVHPNPSPLIVVWAGPLMGIILPLLIMMLCQYFYKPATYLAAFFAGFCLIANGIYIGVGWIDHVGDTAVMQTHGTPVALMIAFGLITTPPGLYLWHRINRKVGLAKTSCCILHRKHVWFMCTLASLITIISFIFGNRG